MIEKKEGLDLSVFIKLLKISKQFNPDIIHTWGPEQALYSIIPVALTNSILVNSMVVDAPADIPLFGKLWRYKALTFPISKYIIANSYAGFHSYNLKPKKGRVIYNGYDMSRQHEISNINTIKRKFGLNKYKTVGMVANISRYKDYITYIRAAQIVLEEDKNIKFLCVGQDKGFKSIVAKEILPQYRKNIIFTGMIEQVESMINCFDVCVLSTYTEGISNSIMEYMAGEKPVIASDSGGTNELILNNETGFLVPVKDFKTMAEKILFLLKNQHIARQMGVAGRKRIENMFSMKQMTKAYCDLYASIEKNSGKSNSVKNFN